MLVLCFPQAFEFLDTEGKGYVTVQDLRDKLGIFYRNLTTKDYKLLMNHKSELTEQDLYNLLVNNELSDFDPVHEAFKIYAPSDNDIIERDTLKEILTALGFLDLSDDDVTALMESLDSDGDGVIGHDDFLQLLRTNGSHVLKKDLRQGGRGGK
jgi:Ca2+-binding EF-hand superfamily protein